MDNPAAVRQDKPQPNERKDVQSLVIEDIKARREVGIGRYGTALQAFNGRDSLMDAYQEALDLACYLRQCIEERDNKIMEPDGQCRIVLPGESIQDIIQGSVFLGYRCPLCKSSRENPDFDCGLCLSTRENG